MSVDRRGLLAGATGAVTGAAVAPGLGRPAAAAGPGRRVRTGLDALMSSRYAPLRGQRVGVITNPPEYCRTGGTKST